MSEPMRILQAFVTNDKGGLTGYIVQNYRHLDKTKVQFDFVTFDVGKLDFEDEFIRMGARFFHIARPSHALTYYKEIKQILSGNSYEAIHFNLSYNNFLPVYLAKLAGTGTHRIILHSHSTGIDDPSLLIRALKQIIHWIGKRLTPLLITDCFACSKLAAKWMFPDSIIKSHKYEVLYNAIDLSAFQYNERKRKKVRKALDIEENVFVVGHVGRFTYQKNHEFLIEIFQEIEKKEPKSILLLIGDGPDRPQIERLVLNYKLGNKVHFLGQRADVADLYQAMDVMVLPSHFEGLCIVAIESQMAALPTICSEELPEETNVSSGYTALSLKKSAKIWADAVLSKKNVHRGDNTEELRKAGYDEEIEIKRIEQLYMHTDVVKL